MGSLFEELQESIEQLYKPSVLRPGQAPDVQANVERQPLAKDHLGPDGILEDTELPADGPNRWTKRDKENWEEILGSLDAVAFYAPFHKYKDWGIYFIEDKFNTLVKRLHQQLAKKLTYDEVYTLTFRHILEHERFHFLTELHAHYWDCAVGQCDCTYNDMSKEARAVEFEEALATAAMIRLRARGPAAKARAFVDELAVVCRQIPGGYSDFEKYLRDFGPACRDFGRSLTGGRVPPWFQPAGPAEKRLVKSVPVRWLLDPRIPKKQRLLFHLGNVDLRKFVSCLRRRFGCQLQEGGKHALIMDGAGKRLTGYSRSADSVPPYLVRELADGLGKSKKEILAQCPD